MNVQYKGKVGNSLDSILGPTVEYRPYKVSDVGFAKVYTPSRDKTLDKNLINFAEEAHANSIRVYDRHGLGSHRDYLENGLKRKAREFVRARAKGGRYTRGSISIPEKERPIILDTIEPSAYTMQLSMDTSKPRTYNIDIGRIEKPGGFYIPHGYDEPMEGMSVIDVTKYLPREEDRQIDMIEKDIRKQAEFYQMMGNLYGVDVRLPHNLRDKIRTELRKNYFHDDLAVGVHEVIGHYEQDARGMLNPKIASMLGTVPIYDRNLVEAQNVKQTSEVIGRDVGYAGLMPLYNEFISSRGLLPNDLLALDSRERRRIEEEYKNFMKNKMN